MEEEVYYCECCDTEFYDEKDRCFYEPLSIEVCEKCHEMLQSAPTEDSDEEMEEMMSNMSIS